MKIRQINFYADEWLSGTHCLDAVEVGVYITACALIYSHGGEVREDELRMRVRCHGNAFNRAFERLVALGKLIVGDGKITNKRCTNEIEKAEKRIENAQENGRKSPGRPKKINDIENQAGKSVEKLTINHQPLYKDSVGSNEPTASPPAQPAPDLSIIAGRDYMTAPDLWAAMFSLGKEIIGKNGGGQIRRLLDAHAGDVQATIDTLLIAKRKDDPRSYIGRIVAGEAPLTDWDAVYHRMGVRL